MSSQPDRILYTPLGKPVRETDLETEGRFECPVCHYAVLEDEGGPCPDCEKVTLCVYCQQAGECPCLTESEENDAAADR